MKRGTANLILPVLAFLSVQPAVAQSPIDSDGCQQLSAIQAAGISVKTATFVGAGEFDPVVHPTFELSSQERETRRRRFTEFPAFCAIAGTLSIRTYELPFQLWLPSRGWDGESVGGASYSANVQNVKDGFPYPDISPGLSAGDATYQVHARLIRDMVPQLRAASDDRLPPVHAEMQSFVRLIFASISN